MKFEFFVDTPDILISGIVQLPTAQLRLPTNSDWGIVQTPSAQFGERNKSYFLQNFIQNELIKWNR